MPPRSAKSAATTRIQKALENTDEDMDSDAHDVSEVSEDEAGKTVKGRRTTTTRAGPAAKKSKTLTETPKKLTVAKTSRRRSLSVLVTMPLDILFEVFGHLSPKDLTSLAKTTKTLRATLLGKSAKSVWINSRAREGGPDPPPDVSEPQWAALIFGHTCMSCETTNVHTIDFGLRRRLCTTCKKRNLLVKHRVKKQFPGIDESVLTYISSSNVGGWAHGHASNKQFYWISDIRDMLHTLAKYEADVRSGKKGAKRALEDFKAKRIEIVKQIRETAGGYNAWAVSAARQRMKDKETAQDKRRDEIVRRFVELGYAEEDVMRYGYRFREEWKKKGEVTERVWARLRALMEPDVQESNQLRLEAANRVVRQARRNVLDGLFKAYKMTLPPDQWKYLPTTALLSSLPPFRDIVEGDSPGQVTDADFAPGMANIAETLAAAKDALKARLTQRAVEFYKSQAKSGGVSALPKGSSTPLAPSRLLELATTVFKCLFCERALYGWDDISSHFCSNGEAGLPGPHSSYYSHYSRPLYTLEYPYEFAIDATRSNFVKGVIKAAGHDPATVTAAEMNALDPRMTCCECDGDNFRSYMALKNHAHTWRGLTDHLTNTHIHGGSELTFKVLSPQFSNLVRAHEMMKIDCGPGNEWACTRCDAHLTRSAQMNDVETHAREKHHNASPQKGVDFIFLPRARQECSINYTTLLE